METARKIIGDWSTTMSEGMSVSVLFFDHTDIYTHFQKL